ncbi:MAG: hypothetical protein AB1402_10285 [Bacillota bacterium]
MRIKWLGHAVNGFEQVAHREFFEATAESGLGEEPVVVLTFAGERVRT